MSDRAKNGDTEALRQLTRVALDLGVGVFNLVHCFSPEIVVIGGGMSQTGALLLDPIRAMLAQCREAGACKRVRLAVAQGGDDMGLKGAAAYWADYMQV